MTGWIKGGKNCKWGKYILPSIILLFLASCGTQENTLKGKLPDNLRAVSTYGEKSFDSQNLKVDFTGWEADAPQTIFIVDQNDRNYLMAYVLPEKLVKEVWGENDKTLGHFTSGRTINVDERTTALALVIMSPPYFWAFTPRAIVYSAHFIVTHEKFEELSQKIASIPPGELTSGKYPEIFALASEIARDVREKIMPAEKTYERIFAKDETDYVEIPCNINDQGIAKLEDAPGLQVKFKAKNMVWYGGGIFNSYDPGKINQIQSYFVLKAQDAKIDLSIDNILTLKIINPVVETTVTLPSYGQHAIRVEKGIEFSLSIFTDPIKRVGLAANFGRLVKYAVEIAVPNIAACIPDGDTWGYAVALAQEILDSGTINSIRGLLSSSWDEIVRVLVSHFIDTNSFIYRILNRVGFASCAYSPNFIINQIAAIFRNFPIVKLYDAFTKYIPFGIELFTKPKTGVYYAAEGVPLPYDIPIVRELYPLPASSPGTLTLKSVGPECTNCRVRLVCPDRTVIDQNVYISCSSQINLYIPPDISGTCSFILTRVETYTQGGFLGFGGTTYSNEIVLTQWQIQVNSCPSCSTAGFPGSVTEYYNKQKEQQGGGCRASSPINTYSAIAIAIIFALRELRRRKKGEKLIKELNKN